VRGPNVHPDGEATNTVTQKLDAGPHQRWATGVLFDRVRMSDSGALLVQNRTWMGSGQGWAGANSVLWNCEVGTYRVDGPPTAHNWAIGCRGEAQIADDQPPGTIQSAGEPVAPASLYTAQLQERMRGR
jgi:hypothetical protein